MNQGTLGPYGGKCGRECIVGKGCFHRGKSSAIFVKVPSAELALLRKIILNRKFYFRKFVLLPEMI